MNPGEVDLFLDSGAFSAWAQNKEIDIQEYIAFVRKYQQGIEVYANLDVIGDPKATWKNQMIMEHAGLHPLPCYHYGDPIKWLHWYLQKGYDYIALGGMVPISTPNLVVWLDKMFGDYLTDEHGMPTVKVHGFGLTSLTLMLRYPWYSVDSTSWVVTGRMGAVFIPECRPDGWHYTNKSFKVSVSYRSPHLKQAGRHLMNFPPSQREQIISYFTSKGYEVGESTFHVEHVGYTLKNNERWASKPNQGKREVETIVHRGLSNDYRLRDEINIKYFLDLEKEVPPWPWAFRPPRIKPL